jgi:hypothetical protein
MLAFWTNCQAADEKNLLRRHEVVSHGYDRGQAPAGEGAEPIVRSPTVPHCPERMRLPHLGPTVPQGGKVRQSAGHSPQRGLPRPGGPLVRVVPRRRHRSPRRWRRVRPSCCRRAGSPAPGAPPDGPGGDAWYPKGNGRSKSSIRASTPPVNAFTRFDGGDWTTKPRTAVVSPAS